MGGDRDRDRDDGVGGGDESGAKVESTETESSVLLLFLLSRVILYPMKADEEATKPKPRHFRTIGELILKQNFQRPTRHRDNKMNLMKQQFQVRKNEFV